MPVCYLFHFSQRIDAILLLLSNEILVHQRLEFIVQTVVRVEIQTQLLCRKVRFTATHHGRHTILQISQPGLHVKNPFQRFFIFLFHASSKTSTQTFHHGGIQAVAQLLILSLNLLNALNQTIKKNRIENGNITYIIHVLLQQQFLVRETFQVLVQDNTTTCPGLFQQSVILSEEYFSSFSLLVFFLHRRNAGSQSM